jgi:ribosomal protein S19
MSHNKNIISNFFLINKLNFFKNLFNKKKIYSRSCSVPSFLVGANIKLYKGKHHVVTKILNNCVGYKFGEFAFSRKPFFFTVKEKKKKNLKR